MTYETIINGVRTYLKAFETTKGVVYVNILTGQIEHPTSLNPMRIAQLNYYRREIERCKLPVEVVEGNDVDVKTDNEIDITN